MAFNEPVLTKRIPLDAEKRHTVWYDEYVQTGGYAALRKAMDMTASRDVGASRKPTLSLARDFDGAQAQADR